MFTISVLGKTFMNEDKKDLMKVLKKNNIIISKTLFDKLVENKPVSNYLVNKKTGMVTKLDITQDNRPLLKNTFGIKQKDMPLKKLKKIRFADINKDYKITQILPKKSKVNVTLKITLTVQISKDKKTFQLNPIYKGFNNKEFIDDFVNEQVESYLHGIPEATVLNLSYDVNSRYTGVKMNFEDMVLREQEILNIFNENIENIVPPEGQNCVKYYINQKYKGMKRKLQNMVSEPTIADLRSFCANNDICFRCYDINKNLVSSHIIKNTKSKCASLNIVAYNNHIYPFKNGFLDRESRAKKYNFQYIEDINTELINYLDSGKLPVFVSTCGKDELSYFINDKNTVISNNKEYEICLSIAKSYGIENKINYNTNISALGEIISGLYLKENTNSVWFNSNLYSKGGFNYSKDIPEEQLNIKNIKTIDKNKCYSYILKELDYLVVTDFTKQQPVTNFDEIVDHYMYIVQPEESSIIFPNTNIYFGSLIKFAVQEKIKFKIIEGFETTTTPNYYKQMIIDLYQKVPDHAKDIINRLIGKFNKDMSIPIDFMKFSKVCNQDETDRSEGYVFELNDKYNIIYKNEILEPKLGTKKPISFQILDASRILLYNKMKELNLKDEDIIKVKTDSISFYTSDLDHGLDLSNDINGWKEEEFKYMQYTNRYDNDLEYLTFNHPLYADNQICKLITGNAGCGKSYDIMNNLIPSLDKSYLIVVPTNATMSEYKKKDFNVKVKQTFTLNNTIPEEDVIIIDEVGMSDYLDMKMIIKCIIAGKDIYAYGDFTQLLPVSCDKQINNDYLIKCLFNENINLDTNFRNNFTSKYYDKLRYKYNKEELINKVNKHSTDWKEAQYIIVYTNEMKDKYNKLKMQQLKLNDICSVGCKVICKSNDLRELNIYNKYRFEVVSSSDKTVCIKDEFKEYNIDKEKFMKFFQPAYALTLYCIQGESIESYYYPKEDYKYINGRSAYTLISRLKTN
jgi:hypothetical protein